MKTPLLIILMFLFACTKEPQDFRDKFTGIYRGTVTFDLPGWQHTRQNNAFIVKGEGQNELAIQTLGIPCYSIAILSNGTYTYYPFTNGSIGMSVTAQYRGSGTFRGDSLFEQGTISVSSYGVIETGTWETRMRKE